MRNQNCNVFSDNSILYSFGTFVVGVNYHHQIAWILLKIGILQIFKSEKRKISYFIVQCNAKTKRSILVLLSAIILWNKKDTWGIWGFIWIETFPGRNNVVKLCILPDIRSTLQGTWLWSVVRATYTARVWLCLTVWSNTSQGFTCICKLQKTQNYVARQVWGIFYFIYYRGTEIVKSENWETMKKRFTYSTADVIFKVVNCLIRHHMYTFRHIILQWWRGTLCVMEVWFETIRQRG